MYHAVTSRPYNGFGSHGLRDYTEMALGLGCVAWSRPSRPYRALWLVGSWASGFGFGSL